MIAVTPIPSASPAIACVRSRRSPNRANAAIAVRTATTLFGMRRPSTNELAREHDRAGGERAERESPAREKRQRHRQDREDVEPERPERAALVAPGRTISTTPTTIATDDQRVEPVRCARGPRAAAGSRSEGTRPSGDRLVLEDDFSVVPEDENGLVTRAGW